MAQRRVGLVSGVGVLAVEVGAGLSETPRGNCLYGSTRICRQYIHIIISQCRYHFYIYREVNELIWCCLA